MIFVKLVRIVIDVKVAVCRKGRVEEEVKDASHWISRSIRSQVDE
jgi:hypothetical protein